MLQSLLLQIHDTLSSSLSGVTHMLPNVLQEHVTLTITLSSLVLAFLVFSLLSMDWSSNLPPRFPILVSALQGKFNLKENGPLDVVRQGFKKHGEIFRIKVLNQGVTFMIGPDANQFFFEAADKDFSQKEVYRFTVPVFGPNIVYDAPPSKMVQQLKFVRSGLSGPAMQAHCHKIVAETENFFAHWADEGVIDLFQSLSELIILTASQCILGKEIREQLHAEVAELYECMNKGMTQVSFFFPNLPTHAHRKRDHAHRELVKIFTRIIKKRREDQAKGLITDENKSTDFLQVLIDSTYRDGSEVGEREISGLLLAALFAGQHTSSITSIWTGALILGQKETLVPRLIQEQKEVLAETNGQVTFDALNKMELLHACVKETLRMFPPLVLLMRKVNVDSHYKNFLIPKGDVAMVCPPVSHRIESIFSNPEKFDPDRWLPPRNEGSGKYDFIAFGQGRHTCLGNTFAFMQIKSIWSTLLRNFDFELIEKPFIPKVDMSSLVAAPGNDCRVRFRRIPDPTRVKAQ